MSLTACKGGGKICRSESCLTKELWNAPDIVPTLAYWEFSQRGRQECFSVGQRRSRPSGRASS